MQNPKNWNGPPRELTAYDDQGNQISDDDMDEESVYCVTCGNIFIHHRRRDCPTCKLADELGLGE